uniref:Uncharacterized protein n=1 Tax=Arundo donax TaxID=35708 RepID=A0A0A8XXE3_ARUDO
MKALSSKSLLHSISPSWIQWNQKDALRLVPGQRTRHGLETHGCGTIGSSLASGGRSDRASRAQRHMLKQLTAGCISRGFLEDDDVHVLDANLQLHRHGDVGNAPYCLGS